MVRIARAVLFALLLTAALPAMADVPVPPLSGRVVDQTGTLSSGDVDALTQKLRDLETRKGSQIAVLIVPTTQPETIEQFSIRVAEAWKIGRKKVDDGAILVVAKNDRHLRIEVGYGLEGSLTDATTRRIIDDDITPKFKSGDFAGGIAAGVDRMIRIVDGEQLPAAEPAHWGGAQSGDSSELFNPFILILVLFLSGPLRATLGRLLGAVVTGAATGVLGWFVAGSMVASVLLGLIAFVVALLAGFIGFGGPYRGSGWSGGAWSGGSGGWSSGSSGGGFSGGGGSFGGGGASGSW